MEKLPFMATENILMYCTKRGGDRQELHEAIRELSVACAKRMKSDGCANTLLEDILNDPRFSLTESELASIVRTEDFIGIAPEQTDDYLSEIVRPLIERYSSAEDIKVSISV